jgi:putative ABC transport system permease protein
VTSRPGVVTGVQTGAAVGGFGRLGALPRRVLAAFEMAADGIRVGRVRSALSALGIAIAVASVVTLLAIGEGARQAVASEFDTLGANVITVQSHSPGTPLDARDAAALAARVPGVVAAVPVVGVLVPVRWRSEAPGVGVLGVTPDLLRIRDATTLAGRFLTPIEQAHRLHVAVLGYGAYRTLFGGADPIGQQVWLGDAAFRVVGVLAPLGGANLGTGAVPSLGVPTTASASGTGAGGSSPAEGAGTQAGAPPSGGQGSSGSGGSAASQQATVAVGTGIDDDVLIPEGTAELLTSSTEVSAIWLKAASASAVAPVIAQSQRILDLRHPGAAGGSVLPGKIPFRGGPPGSAQIVTAAGGGQGITVQSIDALAGEAEKAGSVLALMLTAIAAVSLLVGGLGVMNIMLVTVRERTAEIGVRKAVGARRADVVVQFLAESLLLALIGGFCGWVGSYGGIALLVHEGVRAVPMPGGLGTALLAAAGIGLLFGTYPAYVATTLEPAEALRRQG